MSAARAPLIAGNWKMHPPSREAALELALAVREATAGAACRTVICPPTIWLVPVADALGGGGREVGTNWESARRPCTRRSRAHTPARRVRSCSPGWRST